MIPPFIFKQSIGYFSQKLQNQSMRVSSIFVEYS